MKTPIPQDAAIQEGQTAAQELINQGASAIAIALVDDKRIIWSQRFGLADRDTGQMPTDSTMFGVGSVSKMFAAIAVMKLVDRGVVDLDTPLVTYINRTPPGYGHYLDYDVTAQGVRRRPGNLSAALRRQALLDLARREREPG